VIGQRMTNRISKHLDFGGIQNNSCPICKHKTLRNLSGQYEFDHVGALECGTKHVYNKYCRTFDFSDALSFSRFVFLALPYY
jgi:hypothetical protein